MTANNSLGKMPTPYQEANRYIENAKQTLKEKAGKKDGEYADVKYVQSAAGIAYVGVLLALDEYLLRKEGNKFTKPRRVQNSNCKIRYKAFSFAQRSLWRFAYKSLLSRNSIRKNYD